MKYIFYLLTLVALGYTANAQNKKTGLFSQLRYSASVGLQHNDDLRGYRFAVAANYPLGSHWQIGLGSGFDQYSIKTIPVYTSLAYSLDANATNTAFVFGNAGLAFNIDDIAPVRTGWNIQATFKNAPPAFYSSLGFGYRIGTKGKAAFELTAGYTYTQMQFNYLQAALPVNPYDPFYDDPVEQQYKYQWGRLFFTMGLVF